MGVSGRSCPKRSLLLLDAPALGAPGRFLANVPLLSVQPSLGYVGNKLDRRNARSVNYLSSHCAFKHVVHQVADRICSSLIFGFQEGLPKPLIVGRGYPFADVTIMGVGWASRLL